MRRTIGDTAKTEAISAANSAKNSEVFSTANSATISKLISAAISTVISLAIFIISFFQGFSFSPLLAAPTAPPADIYNSKAYLIVDTALADGRDSVEFEVALISASSGPAAKARVYCASSRKEDSVSVGANADGSVIVHITSRLPGVSKIAFSLRSSASAASFLKGDMGYDEAEIIQTEKGDHTFLVYFIAGSIDPDYCEIEFDKDRIALTDDRHSDNAIGTLTVRTEINAPVANQRVTVYTKKAGVVLYPTRTDNGNFGRGDSITLTTNAEGKAFFAVRSYTLGDALIICKVNGFEFSESVFVDKAENVFEYEAPEVYEPDEEEEKPVISRLHTKVYASKNVGFAYGANARYNIPETEESRDMIVLGGVAMSADEQPVRDKHLVRAYVNAGRLDKNETLTTSEGGAFSFNLTSKDPVSGSYAVGLGTLEQLKGYLEGRVSADACQLLSSGMFAFIDYEWDKYMICLIDNTQALINGQFVNLDVAPFVLGGRTMLTARPIAEAVGAIASWDQSKQTASFYRPSSNSTISMQAGSRTINRTEPFVAPRQYTSDVAAMISNGRMTLPLRALGESFEMNTLYDENRRMVTLYNTRKKAYDPRLDPNSPYYDPARDPDSPDYRGPDIPDWARP